MARMTHANREEGTFHYILPSSPVPLPFAGDYAQVRVVYNAQKVMKLGQTTPLLLEKLNAEERALRQQSRDMVRENAELTEEFEARLMGQDPPEAVLADVHLVVQDLDTSPEMRLEIVRRRVARASEGRPTADEQEAFLLAYQQRTIAMSAVAAKLDQIQRRRALRIIAEVVDHLEWPFSSPAPDPATPASWDQVPDLIVGWIADNQGGLKKVREELQSPLSGPRSQTTS